MNSRPGLAWPRWRRRTGQGSHAGLPLWEAPHVLASAPPRSAAHSCSGPWEGPHALVDSRRPKL